MRFITTLMRHRLTNRLLKWLLFSSYVSIFVLSTTSARAQSENNIWYFGTGIGVDFNAQPIAGPGGTEEVGKLSTNSFSLSPTPFVTQSDADGNLLFYSNGKSVWNRNEEFLQNGELLLVQAGGVDITGVAVLPKGCDQYYLFYIGALSGSVSTIFYSIIDMSLDNGNGGILNGNKGKILSSDGITFMTVVPGLGYNWLVGLRQKSEREVEFHSFKVDSKQFYDVQKSSATLDDLRGLSSSIEFAEDGNSFYFNQSGLLFDNLPMYIFSFNQGSGEITYRQEILPGVTPIEGYASNIIKAIESPNGKLLYTVERYGYCEQLVCYDAYKVFQYRLDFNTKIPILSSKTELIYYTPDDHPIGDIIEGPNGKLYIGRFNSPYIDIIHSPNLLGRACLYKSQSLEFEEGRVQIDMPVKVIPNTEMIHTDQDVEDENFLCNDEDFITLSVNSDCYTQVEWSTGSNDRSIIVDEPGLYNVKMKLGSCEFEQEFEIFDYKESEDLLPLDSVICNDEEILIDLSDTSIESLVWNDGATSMSKIVNSTQSLWVEYEVDNCRQRDSLNVTKHILPENVLPLDTFLCNNQSLRLGQLFLDATYNWSTGSTDPYIVIDSPGVYTYQMRKGRCELNDMIVVEKIEINLSQLKDTSICSPETLRLDAYHPNAVSYRWNTGSRNNYISVQDSGRYVVWVKDANCEIPDTINVRVDFCEVADIYVPNAFTPNNDGINDNFEFFVSDGIEVFAMELNIFDRWGGRLFHSTDLEGNYWDGLYRGRPTGAGTYVYSLDLEVLDSKGRRTINFNGEINLVR